MKHPHIPSLKPHTLPRPQDAHKNTFGHLWIFGGSIGYTGAPRLAADGAMAVGTGLVSICCPQTVWPIVAGNCLEAMVHPDDTTHWHHADTILAGPGWGSRQVETLSELMQHTAPLVLDADALNMIAATPSLAEALRQRRQPAIITPHPGEAARLLDRTSKQVQEDRPATAQALLEKFHCTVVLKGAGTLIASPHQPICQCLNGSVQLARAGTGDVLAGMIAGLLAQAKVQHRCSELHHWVGQAVDLHARAGEQPHWFRAGQLPTLVANLITQD